MDLQTWVGLASGVGLVVFAAVQAGLTYADARSAKKEREHDERLRQEEREHDRERAENKAYGALWAEYARVWRVVEEWSRLDLVHEAAMGVLDASEILPRDWGTSTVLLGELGLLSAHLGGVAYTALTAARDRAIRLNRAVEGVNRRRPNIEFDEYLNNLEPRTRDWLRREEEQLKSLAREGELTLKDALDNSRPGREPMELAPMTVAASKYGKVLQQKLAATSGEMALPSTPPSDETAIPAGDE